MATEIQAVGGHARGVVFAWKELGRGGQHLFKLINRFIFKPLVCVAPSLGVTVFVAGAVFRPVRARQVGPGYHFVIPISTIILLWTFQLSMSARILTCIVEGGHRGGGGVFGWALFFAFFY